MLVSFVCVCERGDNLIVIKNKCDLNLNTFLKNTKKYPLSYKVFDKC